MASVCFYFQAHQPPRLRRYSVFDAEPTYFDDDRNAQICRKVAARCYRPITELLLELIHQHGGRFRVSFSLTGTLLEQLGEYAPDVIEQFRRLAETGCCEFLGETYYHSLASAYSHDEFLHQIDLHARLIEELFNQRPVVFRNTELIYNNELASHIGSLDRYSGILAEGVDHLLGKRSPNYVYRPPGESGNLSLLLKNYRLSDDIAFRFGDRGWREWPLTAEKFAGWIDRINGDGTVCNLFLDVETFGEHQWSETGIFEFMRALPGRVFEMGNDFKTPSECIDAYDPIGVYDAPQLTSWADTERDCSAWMGNAMQSNALNELYRLEAPVKATGDVALTRDWRRLTTSDHFYYMCTKYFADQAVHKYFNPYESPYDSYINFMNVLDNLRARLDAAPAAART